LEKEPEIKVRAKIIEVISRFGPDAKDAVEAIAKCLSNEDRDLRHKAAFALGAIGPEARSVTPLVSALQKLLPPSPAILTLPGSTWVGYEIGPPGGLNLSGEKNDVGILEIQFQAPDQVQIKTAM
jgi:HEAT repeat protein